MNLSWFGPLLLKAKQFCIRNAPHILMGTGTGCSISAVIFAVKATPAATDAIKKVKESNRGDISKLEIIKAGGKYYIAAAGMELFSLLCFWAAHGIDIRRQAVIAGLCSTAEEALREYQHKMQEMIGKDASKEIQNAVAQDYVDKNPPPVQKTVILEDDTDLWWIIDGHYFRSNLAEIKKVENQINHQMIQHMYASRSDLYWLLDPDQKYIKATGEDGMVGWSVDKILVLEHDWGDGPDGKPVGVIHYKDEDGLEYLPVAGFSRMY